MVHSETETNDDGEALDALRRLTATLAGRKMPGERELTARLGVSRRRVRALLDRLKAEGRVTRRQGSGTYAADPDGATLREAALLVDARLKLGDDPFFSRLVERLQLCLQTAGVRCVLERIDGAGRPRFLGDGAIGVGLAAAGALAALRPDDPPAVGLLTGGDDGDASTPPRGRVSLLLADDHGAGRAAAERLLSEGSRRLLFLGRADLPASRARQGGAEAAGRAAGAAFEVWECALNYGAGRDAAARIAGWLAGSDAPPGIIAANDWLAVGLRAGLAAAASGLRPPLVSFDGLPLAADPVLALRSLAFPAETVAADALAELRRLAALTPGTPGAGRVVRYAMTWTDGCSSSGAMPQT